jgi:hypothetical protein
MRTEIRAIIGAAVIAVMGTFAAWPQKSNPMDLMLSGPVDHIDLLAREPMVVQHPNGALFVSGYGPGSDLTEPQAELAAAPLEEP